MYDKAGSSEVIRFLTDDLRNPNSIFSCVRLARENARTVRDQLSDELWEEVNSLYLFTRSAAASELIATDPTRFYADIRRSAEAFLGIASSTISRNEAWEFMNLGRHLERADKTTRFLDVANYLPPGEGDEPASPGSFHWSAILRSCGALGAYHAVNRRITPRGVVDFLVFSKLFPRSIRFCIEKVDVSLHRISATPRGTFANEAERETGRLLADLNFGSTDDAFEAGLHNYLDGLQARFNLIGDAIFESFAVLPENSVKIEEEEPKAPSAAATWKIQQKQLQQQKQ
jgi:uncharacterized alpha-E superfamily protein